jgi:hypothetical protein
MNVVAVPMTTAFFRHGGRGTGPGRSSRAGRQVKPMAASRRLPCPCSARHARATRTRIVSTLALTGLVAMAMLGVSGTAVRAQPAANAASTVSGMGLPAGHGSGVAARFILIAVAVAAVGAFALLQVIARSQRRRWSAFADWRTWPPGYDPWTGPGDPVAGQHDGSAYRPGYGFLPGPGQAGPSSRDRERRPLDA